MLKRIYEVPQTTKSLFDVTAKMWLEQARRIAERKLRATDNVFAITVEDVMEDFPLPKYLSRNTIGQIFHDRRFRPFGTTVAKHWAARNHIIRTWILNEEDE